MLCLATIHTWVKIFTTQPQVLQAQEDDVIGLGSWPAWNALRQILRTSSNPRIEVLTKLEQLHRT
jgi:hypothetical protein